MGKLNVACNSGWSGALSKDGEIVRRMNAPKKDYSSDVEVSLLGDTEKGRMLHKGLVELSKGRVCLDHNIVLATAGNRIMLNVHRVDFELVYNRLNLSHCQQVFNMMR